MEKQGKKVMTKAKIRASILEQLTAKGADVDLYLDQIDKYVWLWEQVERMRRDIRKNGTEIDAVSSTGNAYRKENPAVQNVLRYMQQMDRILTRLNLSTENCQPPDDEL